MSRIGLIITTYSGPAYVHLTLESVRRLKKDVQIIVHDDCSGNRELKRICDLYGVELISTQERLGHVRGDIAGIIAGYNWGVEKNLDVVIKISRRFIPKTDIIEEIQKSFIDSKFSTCSAQCLDFKLPFRSEAMAMKIDDWRTMRGNKLLEAFFDSGDIIYVEALINYIATKIYKRMYLNQLNTLDISPFYKWKYLGESRKMPNLNYIWHESNTKEDYSSFAMQLGLTYSPENFNI